VIASVPSVYEEERLHRKVLTAETQRHREDREFLTAEILKDPQRRARGFFTTETLRHRAERASKGIDYEDDDEDELRQAQSPEFPAAEGKNGPKCDKANIDGPFVQAFPSVPLIPSVTEAMLTGVC
jgi:hypothetical protein